MPMIEYTHEILKYFLLSTPPPLFFCPLLPPAVVPLENVPMIALIPFDKKPLPDDAPPTTC